MLGLCFAIVVELAGKHGAENVPVGVEVVCLQPAEVKDSIVSPPMPGTVIEEPLQSDKIRFL